MQLKLIITSSMLFFLFGCSGWETKKALTEHSETNKKLLIKFIIKDSVVNISDHFHLLFTNGMDTLRPSVKGNQLVLPSFEGKKGTGYTASFEYDNYKLNFKGITKQMIFPEQDVEWIFGVEPIPMKNNYKGLLSNEEYKSQTKYSELQYLQFNLLEKGDGIQFVNKVE